MSEMLLQGPTLANPERFHTVKELRHEMHRMNATLLDQFLTIARLDEHGAELAGTVTQVLMLHMRKDLAGMVDLLDTYLTARPQLREQLEDEIESMRLRATN